MNTFLTLTTLKCQFQSTRVKPTITKTREGFSKKPLTKMVFIDNWNATIIYFPKFNSKPKKSQNWPHDDHIGSFTNGLPNEFHSKSHYPMAKFVKVSFFKWNFSLILTGLSGWQRMVEGGGEVMLCYAMLCHARRREGTFIFLKR